MDDPGMFRVSRESTDILTGGVGSQASMDDPEYPGIHGYSDRGGASMDDPGMFHILP